MIASGVLLAGVSIFAAVQTKKLVNLKNTVRAGEIKEEIQNLKRTMSNYAMHDNPVQVPSLSEMFANAAWEKSMTEKIGTLELELANLTKKLPKNLS